MNLVNFRGKHFHRLVAAGFLIIVILAPHQAVRSAESGVSNFDGAPAPAEKSPALAKSSRHSDVMGSAYRFLGLGSEYGVETGV